MFRFSPQRLRSVRCASGVKAERLALDLNRTAHTVSAWERGHATPSAAMVARIANVLRVSPGELFERVDQ